MSNDEDRTLDLVSRFNEAFNQTGRSEGELRATGG